MITSWSLLLLSVMTGTLSTSTDIQQWNGPIISPSKNEIILQNGQNFTIYCNGNSKLQIKQQEISEEVTGKFKKMWRNVSSGSVFEVALDLFNVDQFAVGYYACFDDTVPINEVLVNITAEPKNTPHISYIYVYVNGTNVFAPMWSFIIAKGKKFVIECKPTAPDVSVKLLKSPPGSFEYSPKIGFIFSRAPERSQHKCEAQRGNETFAMHIRKIMIPPPIPKISGGHRQFLKGETFTLSCSVKTQTNIPVALTWVIPGNFSKVINSSNERTVLSDDNVLFNNYTIVDADKEDAGRYICKSNSHQIFEEAYFEKVFLERPEIDIIKIKKDKIIEITGSSIIRLRADVYAYPPADIEFLLDNKPINILDIKKYLVSKDSAAGRASLTVRYADVMDTGNYTFVATNKYINKSITFDVRVTAPPKIVFRKDDMKRVEGTIQSINCSAYGYPLPTIEWIFSNDDGEQVISKDNQTDTEYSLFHIESSINILVRVSGTIMCKATNKYSSTNATTKLLMYELPNGFGIKDPKTWFVEYDDVKLRCLASKYDFVNVTWNGEDGAEIENVEYSTNDYSHVAKLRLNRIYMEQAGNYTCTGLKENGTYEEIIIPIAVSEQMPLEIMDPEEHTTLAVEKNLMLNLTCDANAVPPPEVEWLKDGKPLKTLKANVKINTRYYNHSSVSSLVMFTPIQNENFGEYKCRVTSQNRTLGKMYSLVMKSKLGSNKDIYLSVIGVIFFVLILLVVYLTWKIKKEKQFRRELAAAGLLYFKEGVTKSINPELGIGEQAELLPYDEKFEFPSEKLILGKQLGAGAFGVVYKAEARGIINAEETTIVAVKMVKKTADNMFIKALASELKIMVHLGKHVNIVNLLGACTKNVGKRELSVIVEYCRFGNIHNYLQKHRDVFIDQLTDNPEKNLGKVNRAYSCSSGNSGMQSDYFGSNHTQETDNTLLNTGNTNRSGRKDISNKQVEFLKVSESGYIQPEWRSNYESDYVFEGRSPRPLCSRDLLAWAFQIARGMEYLASRKVLHGDLAARNILLADDNIVKICDFGLAKSIYKNDEYQKKENSPLPVKWLAIECMTDRIFSTQSDVWSFGIVLWELFSLAKTPYPNISAPSLLQWLSEGRRLEKPAYADDRIYDVMKRCWEHKPTARPNFSQLQDLLGTFLEDNVRNHYVDLNAAYMDVNIKRDGEEDYLAMVSAPDYNNLVTPSPHHYVNSPSFFPPTAALQHDDEGYLQMSPATRQVFNPRNPGNKFDLDARKLTPRVPEANSFGSESTPMLTLNNLPRSGSESDHEGNSSPYLNMCPRIEEETDEVFETKQNNVRNTQPSAITNPTYIKISVDDEKKLQNITNNYINVPNGLVK